MVQGLKVSPSERAECRRLRVEEKISVGDIGRIIGLSKATVSAIVKDLPLSLEDRSRLFSQAARRGNHKKPASEAKRSARTPSFSLWEIMQKKALTTDQKGAIAEAAVILRLKIWGFVPHLPLCPGGPSDIVVYVPDTKRFVRIQVKTAHYGKHGNGALSLRAKCKGKPTRYQNGSFDFAVAYDPLHDRCYVYGEKELTEHGVSKAVSNDAFERWDKLIDM